jgi:uncharacterized protein
MAFEPVQQSERIQSLDVLRGFALLGILVMNISAFSMPTAAYFNPTAWGRLDGLDGWFWQATHLLADFKFMAIFSMLFGAGIVLMWQRAEARSQGSAGIHYRRMFWLIVFGLLHAHLLWYGDILYWYGMTGLLVYLFRKRSPPTLIVLGVLFLGVASALMYLGGVSFEQWPEAARAEVIEKLDPPEAIKQEEISQYRGTWLEQMQPRRVQAIELETSTFLTWALWRIGGLMLLGMALFKLGVLSAARSRGFYITLIALAALIGIPATWHGIQYNLAIDWRAPEFFFLGLQFNYWASVLVAMGWIGAVILLCQRGVAWFTRPLAAVGQMAFSNYILHSLICTTLFYGHGFGLFATVERTGQMLIVLAVWILQLTVSPIWMRHFRYGPLEWLWRSVVYLKLQPFRRKPHPDRA